VDRSRLEEKRRLLQLRRERQDQSRTFREVARSLCELGLRRFSKIPPARCQQIASRFSHLPGRDERFVWPDRDRRAWHDDVERDFLFRQALLACTNLEGSLAVIFHTHQAGLRIEAPALAEHAGAVIGPQFEAVWITAFQPAPWLIEVARQDREICYTLQA